MVHEFHTWDVNILKVVAKLLQVDHLIHLQEVVAEENRPHAHALAPESLASPPYKQQQKCENLSFTSVLTIKIGKF